MTASAEVDALFKLPLGEFTPARNALVAQLKKAGRQDEASEAKALTKPSVSAWVVNQLYWRHRGLFDRLIEAGDRMRRAQAAQMTGDAAREPANARREVLTALIKIAEGLLLGGDYGATRDMLRRVTTTLEALSSYGSLPDAPPAGRLTDDVEPPGFEALGGLLAGGRKRRRARSYSAYAFAAARQLAKKSARATAQRRCRATCRERTKEASRRDQSCHARRGASAEGCSQAKPSARLHGATPPQQSPLPRLRQSRAPRARWSPCAAGCSK